MKAQNKKQTDTTNTTRERWLNDFVELARPIFEDNGFPIPEKIRVSVGWTSKGARGKAIGECWSHKASADGTFEIFVSPLLSDASRVCDVLTHELIHAAVGLECGHRGQFRVCAVKLGLEGRMTATIAGTLWHEWADPIVEKLGAFPHATLKGQSSGKKKQTTRMLKAECECGYVIRLTKTWAEQGLPTCMCGGAFTLEAK